MKLTIGKRVIIGFVASAAITVGLGIFALGRFGHVEKDALVIANDGAPTLQLAGKIELCVTRNYGRVYQGILCRDSAAIEKIQAEMSATSKEQTEAMAEYEKTIDNEAERQHFNQIAPAREA